MQSAPRHWTLEQVAHRPLPACHCPAKMWWGRERTLHLHLAQVRV